MRESVGPMLPTKRLRQWKKTAIYIGLFLLAVFFLAVPGSPVLAGDAASGNNVFGLDVVGDSTALGGGDIRVIIAQIIRAVLGLLGIIALVLMLYAGYMIMTSAGDEEKVSTGKRTLINATIGLAIILSAFAITQFILNQLGRATGFAGLDGAGGTIGGRQTFSGSGALGRALKDHYPFRDARDVPRNTRISVTFFEAVDPASLIEDRNGANGGPNGTIGDCVQPTTGAMDVARDCDRLRDTAVRIFQSSQSNTLVPAAAIASPEGENNDVFTIVFRPLAPLGSETSSTMYTVELTSAITKKINPNNPGARQPSIFQNTAGNRYIWQFETNTTLDTRAPKVVSTYPAAGGSVPRNSIAQVIFDEEIDPTTVQGSLRPGTGFRNIAIGGTAATGEWRAAAGYKAVEFVSSRACAPPNERNSCGELMYCLEAGAYSTLLRTAELMRAGSFEAVPGSGITDMAGNALDGNRNNQPEGKPTMPNDVQTIGSTEFAANAFTPDNFGWRFTVLNTIDVTAPFIEQVRPSLDEGDVDSDAPVAISFSKPMWAYTLSTIQIEEFGLPTPRSGEPAVDPMWYRVRIRENEEKTVAQIDHREFGPNQTDVYYFPTVPSTVKSLQQNCLYPGRGPVSNQQGATPVCRSRMVGGVEVFDPTCAPVTVRTDQDTACVQTTNPATILQPNLTACLGNLRAVSPRSP